MSRARLFQGLLNVAGPSLTSGAITTGLSLATGDTLPASLLYGAADTLASAGSVGAVRALRPKAPMKIIDTKTGKETIQQGTSKLELPVNVIASIGSGMGVNKLLGRDQPMPPPTDILQSQQILQENIQRDMLNSELAGKYANLNAYSPGTMFQMQGLESTLPMMQQAYGSMRDREALYALPELDLAALNRDMGAIVGV